MRILVISHTEHYTDANGTTVGWGPTVKELDALADAFGEVVHIACLHNSTAPASAIPYNGNVRFVPIKPFGGKGILNKLSILISAFTNMRIIRREMMNADVFQFRAPTSIGLYLIPYLSFFSSKKGWYKYAGNWVQKNGPISYRLQKWMLLSLQNRNITINGSWDNQPLKCISFENPCITNEERIEGLNTTQQRMFTKPARLCFVGRLDAEKGIDDILQAINDYPDKNAFSGLDIVGDGAEMEELKFKTKDICIPITFHGSLSREKVISIYKNADFILLPSKSEGFPKVIAEAANYGCIPIVSDVSAIGQYVNTTNGFLWKPYERTFSDFFRDTPFNNNNVLKGVSLNAYYMAAGFTYDAYIRKLRKYILVEQ